MEVMPQFSKHQAHRAARAYHRRYQPDHRVRAVISREDGGWRIFSSRKRRWQGSPSTTIDVLASGGMVVVRLDD